MLTNKIKDLIQQLDAECVKEGVVISLTAFDEDGEICLLQTQNKAGAIIAIEEQVKQLTKIPDCDCENCTRTRTEQAASTHEFHVSSPEELVDALDRILKGEFN